MVVVDALFGEGTGLTVCFMSSTPLELRSIPSPIPTVLYQECTIRVVKEVLPSGGDMGDIGAGRQRFALYRLLS